MDNNSIKDIIHKIIPNAKIILFGSRAKGTARQNSDYDILIIVPDSIVPNEKKKITSTLRRNLALSGIDADIIVQFNKTFIELKNFPGNVSRWADKEGILL